MENLQENQSMDIPRQPLTERLDNWWLEKNNFKAFNGGCAIEADSVKTLELLRDNVQPRQENLPDMIRASVIEHDKQHRVLEVIWAEKIAEGATHVGVLDGSFHFFKGEEILPEDNVDLRISAMPAILQLRAKEKQMIVQAARQRVQHFRDEYRLPDGDDAAAPRELPNIPEVQPGVNISAGETALT